MPTDACLPSLPEIAHDSARVHHRIATPPPTASRSVHRSAFTVYGIAVRKGASNWQVFRRYREWEDLRMRLLQELGSAPPMPPKMLFGRMRPEVIENRVLGLNHFLQLCLNTHMFASHPVLHDFLERNKNVPPEVRFPPLDLPRLCGRAPLWCIGPSPALPLPCRLRVSTSRCLTHRLKAVPVASWTARRRAYASSSSRIWWNQLRRSAACTDIILAGR